MSHDTETLRRIGHGLDAEAFLAGPVGTYLLSRAEAEIQEAREALCEVDPEDAKAIRQLQAQAWRATSFENWIAELIQNGRDAQRELQGGEE